MRGLPRIKTATKTRRHQGGKGTRAQEHKGIRQKTGDRLGELGPKDIKSQIPERRKGWDYGNACLIRGRRCDIIDEGWLKSMNELEWRRKTGGLSLVS